MPTGIYLRTKAHSESISLGLKGKKKKPFTDEHKKNISIARKNQIGELVGVWKGDKVSYSGLHHYVRKYLGTPSVCENCGANDLSRRSYHWSNISGEYKRELSDWARLCVTCHQLIDNYVQKGLATKRLRGLVK